MREGYFKDTPWICVTYPVTDDEADDNGGQSRVIFDCCICGEVKEQSFILPAEKDPVWETVDPQRGLPEGETLKREFQLAHIHEGLHGDPVMIWAKPLRNLAALRDGVDLAKLKQRLLDEIRKAGKCDG